MRAGARAGTEIAASRGNDGDPRVSRPGWAVLAALLVGVPWIAGDFYVNLTSQIFIAAIFAASLNLLVGYGGLTSLGHAAYLGMAAYASGWMYLRFGLPHWIIAPSALLFTTMVAGLFGLVALRATGLGFQIGRASCRERV